MTAKCISSTLLKNRTLYAVERMLRLNGLKFKGNLEWKSQISLVIGMPPEMYEQLQSLAAAQGVTVRKLCRTIIQEGMRNLNDGRTVSGREWRQWQLEHQKGATE